MKKKSLMILSLTALMGIGMIACAPTPAESSTPTEESASSAPAPESSAPATESSSSSEAPASSSSEAPASSSSQAPASSSSSSSAAPVDVKTLASIAVDTTAAKTSYDEGETFTSDGLVVTATYNHTLGEDTTEAVALTDCKITIKDATGATISSLAKAGDYVVEVEYQGKTATYSIRVAKTFMSLADAMKTALKNKSKVKSGTASQSINKFGVSYKENYSYEYGDTVTSVVADGKTYTVYDYDGEAVTILDAQDYSGNQIPEVDETSFMKKTDGLNFYFLWDNLFNYEFYGTEDAVKGIYDLYDTWGFLEREIKTPTEADPKYGYTEYLNIYDPAYNDPWAFKVDVSFELTDENTMDNVTIKTLRYDMESVNRDDNKVFLSFAENPTTNFTSTATVKQTLGERTLKAKYNLDDYFVESYGLKDSADKAYESGEHYSAFTGDSLELYIDGLNPTTANFLHTDRPTITVDDEDAIKCNYTDFSWNSFKECFQISFKEAGQHWVKITTWNITKTIYFDVEIPVLPVEESEYYGSYIDVAGSDKKFKIDENGIAYGDKVYAITDSTDQWVKGQAEDGTKITFFVVEKMLQDEDGITYEIDRSVTKIKYSEWYKDWKVATQNGKVYSGWACNIHEDGIHFIGADGVDHLYQVTDKESNKLYGKAVDGTGAQEIGETITVWKMNDSMYFLLGTNYSLTGGKDYTPATPEEPEEPEEPAKTIADYYGVYKDSSNKIITITSSQVCVDGQVYALKGLNADGTQIVYDTGDWLNPEGYLFISADGTIKGLYPLNKAFSKITTVPEDATFDYSAFYGTYTNDNGDKLTISASGISDSMGSYPVFYVSGNTIAIYDTVFGMQDSIVFSADGNSCTALFYNWTKDAPASGETTGPAWAPYKGTYTGDDGSFTITDTEIDWGWTKSTILSMQDGVIVASGMFGEERYTFQADGKSFEYGGHIYTNPTLDLNTPEEPATAWAAYVGKWSGGDTSFTITDDGFVDWGWQKETILEVTATGIHASGSMGDSWYNFTVDNGLESFGTTYYRA